MKIPKAIENMIEAFERLPGIGPKTASRLTFYLLNVPEGERTLLAQAVSELGEKTKICERCFNIAEGNDKQETVSDKGTLCDICEDRNRDQSTICVVEDPLDLIALEKTGRYHGLYHVLGGAISPLEHIGPEDLKINQLMSRLKSEPVKEVILATNPSLEGEATAMYLKRAISQESVANSRNIRITRIARGIPTGGDLEYADELTLTKSLEGRQDF